MQHQEERAQRGGGERSQAREDPVGIEVGGLVEETGVVAEEGRGDGLDQALVERELRCAFGREEATAGRRKVEEFVEALLEVGGARVVGFAFEWPSVK
jgi:hypothetical protein